MSGRRGAFRAELAFPSTAQPGLGWVGGACPGFTILPVFGLSSQRGLQYVEQLEKRTPTGITRPGFKSRPLHPWLCDFEPSSNPFSLDSPSVKCVSWQLLCLFAGIFPRAPLEGGAGGLGRCEETLLRPPHVVLLCGLRRASADAVPVPSACSLQAAHRPAGRVCAVWPKWEHILPYSL